jgi:hypothetical protein
MKRTCKLPNCQNVHEALGYCKKHYRAYKKWGDPLTVKTSSTQFTKGHTPINYSGNTKCSIDGCDRPHRGKGMCQVHYMRAYHHNDPLYRPSRMRGSAKDRLDNMTDLDLETGCLVWRGAVDKRGYGRITDDTGWRDMAHRLSYKLNVGEIPRGLVIHHKCYNTRCVNPEHLEPTTHNDNIVTKGKSNAAYLNSIKTHCNQGHEFTQENTYYHTNKWGKKNRTCKTCHKKRVENYLKKKANL